MKHLHSFFYISKKKIKTKSSQARSVQKKTLKSYLQQKPKPKENNKKVSLYNE